MFFFSWKEKLNGKLCHNIFLILLLKQITKICNWFTKIFYNIYFPKLIMMFEMSKGHEKDIFYCYSFFSFTCALNCRLWHIVHKYITGRKSLLPIVWQILVIIKSQTSLKLHVIGQWDGSFSANYMHYACLYNCLFNHIERVAVKKQLQKLHGFNFIFVISHFLTLSVW